MSGTRSIVVGAGPCGLVTAIGLARRGHRVTVVDRDRGPAADGSWERRGVMQFHHPHGFRPQVVEVLRAVAPEVEDALVDSGAERFTIPGPSGATGLRCRRMTFERVLREVATVEPGVSFLAEHADEVLVADGRAVGVLAGEHRLEADLVVAASGRSGRLGEGLRAPEDSADTGIAYVSRQWRLRPGAELGPMSGPVAGFAIYPGYGVIVFPHEAGVFSTLVLRGADDHELRALRHTAAYDAAAAAIPMLAAWTDPERAEPITDVLPGGRLHNTYRGQLDADGEVPLPGLVFVGDAVCTTNPAAGRGISTSLMQVRRLLELVDDHGVGDAEAMAADLDAWCADAIRPWFLDHVANDASLRARWAGQDVDLDRPLPSDLIVAALAADESLLPAVGPYLGMNALPSSLDAVQDKVRAIYASGWRPAVPDGPSREELVSLVAAAAGDAASSEVPSGPASSEVPSSGAAVTSRA